jgi:hypothetical protein
MTLALIEEDYGGQVARAVARTVKVVVPGVVGVPDDERSRAAAEKHRKIGRDGIVGRPIGGRNVGEIERPPGRNARREQRRVRGAGGIAHVVDVGAVDSHQRDALLDQIGARLAG